MWECAQTKNFALSSLCLKVKANHFAVSFQQKMSNFSHSFTFYILPPPPGHAVIAVGLALADACTHVGGGHNLDAKHSGVCTLAAALLQEVTRSSSL